MNERSYLSTYFNIFLVIVLFVFIQSLIFVIGPTLRVKTIIDQRVSLFIQRYPYQECTYQYTVHLNTSVTIAKCTVNSVPYLVAIDDESNLISALDLSSNSYQRRVDQIRESLVLSEHASILFSFQNQAWVIVIKDNQTESLYDYETLTVLWKVRKE